jgi:hypothetical protein
MARIADFVAIQDHGSTLPHPQTGSRNVRFPPFDAPDVSGAPAILAFKVESAGDVVLSATLNATLLFEQPFRTAPARSWHEVISTPGLVRAAENRLGLTVTGQGSVTVSDVVLHFQAWAPAPPTPFIAAQETRYSQPLSCGARTGVIVISGRHFLQSRSLEPADIDVFLRRDQGQVRDQLEEYAGEHPEVGKETTEILMMDVERPHPRNLHAAGDDERKAAIVDAYKTRIAALRAVFPKAKLCMYGTLNPDGRGRPDNEQYLARLDALKTAGEQGLYDELDYLVPVLYPRFGPDDPKRAWRSYRAYTEQGIEGSRQLRRSDGTSLPLLPVTGLRIYNKEGNTAHRHELLLDLPGDDPLGHTLRTQLGVMVEKGVQQVVIWVGKDSDLLAEPNPNGRTVTQHVCAR